MRGDEYIYYIDCDVILIVIAYTYVKTHQIVSFKYTQCYGLNCVPQISHAKVLTPNISECDHIWETGALQM